MTKRKLQIFLSSTYEDLIDHRLAAMEAILAAGHIPAAMEQFSPGDETAWEKIRRWIDESDGFILILGGRYGSLEPVSGKSYVELEYDYAVETKTPFFSLVVDWKHHEERVKSSGFDVDERNNVGAYKAFRGKVTERLCRFWTDQKDIKSAIFQKLPEWNQNPELVGWIRGNEGAGPEVASELAQLSQENHELRAKAAVKDEDFDGITFKDRVDLLRADGVYDYVSALKGNLNQVVSATARTSLEELVEEDYLVHMGHVFEALHESLAMGGVRVLIKKHIRELFVLTRLLDKLIAHGLVVDSHIGSGMLYVLAESGRRFRNRMLLVGNRSARMRQLWSPGPTTTDHAEISERDRSDIPKQS